MTMASGDRVPSSDTPSIFSPKCPHSTTCSAPRSVMYQSWNHTTEYATMATGMHRSISSPPHRVCERGSFSATAGLISWRNVRSRLRPPVIVENLRVAKRALDVLEYHGGLEISISR